MQEAGDARHRVVPRHGLGERAESPTADDALLALHHEEGRARRLEQRVEVDRHQESAYSRRGLSSKIACFARSDRSARPARIFTVSGNLQSQWQ